MAGGGPKYKLIKRGFAPPWHGKVSGGPKQQRKLIDPEAALLLAMELRRLNDALPHRDDFADSLVKYFRRHGSITGKQKQAAENWIKAVEMRCRFDDVPLPTAETGDRFDGLLENDDDDD